jgi:hypothetical protein
LNLVRQTRTTTLNLLLNFACGCKTLKLRHTLRVTDGVTSTKTIWMRAVTNQSEDDSEDDEDEEAVLQSEQAKIRAGREATKCQQDEAEAAVEESKLEQTSRVVQKKVGRFFNTRDQNSAAQNSPRANLVPSSSRENNGRCSLIMETARITMFFIVLPKGARNVWRYVLDT